MDILGNILSKSYQKEGFWKDFRNCQFYYQLVRKYLGKKFEKMAFVMFPDKSNS